MALDGGVIALVLLAAVMHASWNAMVKVSGDRLVTMALIQVMPALLSFAAIPFVALPAPESWPFLGASLVLHVSYYVALLYAYEHGDLSQVYPIARGSAPMLVALAAWVLAGEALSPVEWLGVAVVSAGITSLAWRRGARRVGETRSIVFALLTALAIGSYSISDGMGVRRAGEPLGYILWLFALDGLPVIAVALWWRRGRIREAFVPQLARGLFGGVLTGVAYSIVIWAMSLGPMAHVIALRETSVLIAAAIGTLLLSEPFGKYRIVAAAVVATGAVLLNAGL